MAGIMGITGMEGTEKLPPPHWFMHVAVDRVGKAVRMTTAAGGKVIRVAVAEPNTGRIAIVSDPMGAAVGLKTPAPLPG